eukprot:5240569-Karenia_brevis.AAC.1
MDDCLGWWRRWRWRWPWRDKAFEAGEWEQLLVQCRSHVSHNSGQRTQNPANDEQAREEKALARVRNGALSKARQALASSALAPGTQATLDELTNPALRPPRATVNLSPEVVGFQPPAPVVLDRGKLA